MRALAVSDAVLGLSAREPARPSFASGVGPLARVRLLWHCASRGARFCMSAPAQLTWRAAPTRRTSPEDLYPQAPRREDPDLKAALEGERKQVTVLFADLKGSMELLPDRDPEEARKLLDPVLEHMMEAVHRYEGTVNQVMGDGIMALFGAPLAHEDHAVRACYAALRMQESVKRYATGVRKVEGIPIQIRVGLNSGEVCPLHRERSAHGLHGGGADDASRGAHGTDGHAGVDPDDRAHPELGEGYVQVNALGALPVKGLSGPMEVYESSARDRPLPIARGPRADRIRRPRPRDGAAAPRPRPGDGRKRAGRGRRRRARVGKSRLYWEFTRSHRIAGSLVLESRSVSYGTAMLYLPVIDLLKAYFQIDAGDVPRRMREKVTGKLLSLDEALRPTLPAVLALLDLPVDDAAWQALDPLLRRQRTLEAVKRLLLRESQVQPVLVVFEDLHWIDSETQALLDSLVESLPTARLLLLVNYRPEYRHAWGSKTYYRQLHIDPLPPESAEVLLHGLLGDDATLDRSGPSSFLAPGATRSFSRRACGPWSRPASWSASAGLPRGPRAASIQIPRRSRQCWPPALTGSRRG